MLQFKNLTTIYKTPKGEETAIDDVSITINKGEFVGILGPSGAGKSTLIRCINQLVRPTNGEVVWNGKPLHILQGKELRLARRDIGMIFQQFHLIPRLTVLQNALLGCFGYRSFWQNVLGIITKEHKHRTLEALERVGISHMADKRVDQLSGGQQQRVAIARVLMQKPQLLLGDEPVASLDPITSKKVLELVKDIHKSEGMTTIINLHDVGLAVNFCERIIGLSKGKVVFDGAPDKVTDEVMHMIYG